MSYRRELHFDVLKVDRVFITISRRRRRRIPRAIVEMAHALAARFTAEAVETAAQLDAGQTIGYDAVHGFLLAHPSAAPDMAPTARCRPPPRSSGWAFCEMLH